MKLWKYIPVALFVLFAGCAEKPQPINHWQQVKLEELMPQGKPLRSGKMIVGLSVFFFQVETEKYSHVQNTLARVDGLKINYSDIRNFSANGLLSGGGDFEQWQKIAASLSYSQATIAKRITLFMQAGTGEIIEAAKFEEPLSLAYQTAEEAFSMLGLPRGSFFFSLKADSLIGLKQACRLEINTIYQTIPQRIIHKRFPAWQQTFDSANVSATIRPGQFIFLAPYLETSSQEQSEFHPDLGQRIFAVKDRKDATKFCLIFCGLIND